MKKPVTVYFECFNGCMKYSTLEKFYFCKSIVALTDVRNVALYQLLSLLCSYRTCFPGNRRSSSFNSLNKYVALLYKHAMSCMFTCTCTAHKIWTNKLYWSYDHATRFIHIVLPIAWHVLLCPEKLQLG